MFIEKLLQWTELERLEDLTTMTRCQLLKYRGIGPRAITLIERELEPRGLSLAPPKTAQLNNCSTCGHHASRHEPNFNHVYRSFYASRRHLIGERRPKYRTNRTGCLVGIRTATPCLCTKSESDVEKETTCPCGIRHKSEAQE
jgi:hypothetical protein